MRDDTPMAPEDEELEGKLLEVCAKTGARIRSLHAQVGALQAERDEARVESERRGWLLDASVRQSVVLRDALVPFAELADLYGDDDPLVTDDHPAEGILLGACRRARAALAAPEAPGAQDEGGADGLGWAVARALRPEDTGNA